MQLNALLVWAGIGLIGFGVGALMVALQSRPKRDLAVAQSVQQIGTVQPSSVPVRGREMAAS